MNRARPLVILTSTLGLPNIASQFRNTNYGISQLYSAFTVTKIIYKVMSESAFNLVS